MTSKIYAITGMATVLTLAQVWAAQTPTLAAAATEALRPEAAVVGSASTLVRTTDRRQWYHRNAYYRYYRSTLPYDGYRPYAPPIYQCPYFGSPTPLYPYCWRW
jgi:hypothetical protein